MSEDDSAHDRPPPAPRRSKTPSFQITSVYVGGESIASNAGDDSGDDGESDASDRSFSPPRPMASVPVIPTSSRYGLAIVGGGGGTSGDAGLLKAAMACADNIVARDASVSVTATGSVMDMVEGAGPPRRASRNERFRLVKIESTEPFRCGRWVCMDYLDHNATRLERLESELSACPADDPAVVQHPAVSSSQPPSGPPSEAPQNTAGEQPALPQGSAVALPADTLRNLPPQQLQQLLDTLLHQMGGQQQQQQQRLVQQVSRQLVDQYRLQQHQQQQQVPVQLGYDPAQQQYPVQQFPAQHFPLVQLFPLSHYQQQQQQQPPQVSLNQQHDYQLLGNTGHHSGGQATRNVPVGDSRSAPNLSLGLGSSGGDTGERDRDGGGGQDACASHSSLYLTPPTSRTDKQGATRSAGALGSPAPAGEDPAWFDARGGSRSETALEGAGPPVAIDNKIEQAMDLVKSHLMFAVREEVEVLRERIAELTERIAQLESENALLRSLGAVDGGRQQQPPTTGDPS